MGALSTLAGKLNKFVEGLPQVIIDERARMTAVLRVSFENMMGGHEIEESDMRAFSVESDLKKMIIRRVRKEFEAVINNDASASLPSVEEDWEVLVWGEATAERLQSADFVGHTVTARDSHIFTVFTVPQSRIVTAHIEHRDNIPRSSWELAELAGYPRKEVLCIQKAEVATVVPDLILQENVKGMIDAVDAPLIRVGDLRTVTVGSKEVGKARAMPHTIKVISERIANRFVPVGF